MREFEIGDTLLVNYLLATFEVKVVSKEFNTKFGDYEYGLDSHGDVRQILGCDPMIIGKVKENKCQPTA